MKKVIVLFGKKVEKGKNKGLKEGYECLFSLARERGIEIFIARISDYNSKNNNFKRALSFSGKRWIWKKNIKADFVYNRSGFPIKESLSKKKAIISQKNNFANKISFDEILSDKWKTYQKFRRISPEVFLIKNNGDIKKIKKLKTDKIILKPQFGYAGKGIKILKKNNFKKIRFPFIAQEMVETDGIKNIIDGPHDLRVLLINNRPFYSFIRIPDKGKLVANVHQGGKRKNVSISKIPSQARKLVGKIARELKDYKRNFYSIDMMFDKKQKPWLIELNSRPGIAMIGTSKRDKDIFYKNLIKFFK